MVALLLAFVAAMTPFVAEPDVAYAQANTNSSLSNLTLSAGNLVQTGSNATAGAGFAASHYDYTARVRNSVGRITVGATADVSGAQVQIAYGTGITPGAGSAGSPVALPTTGVTHATGGSVPLDVGDTVIGIQVTSNDGTISSVYRITVTRVPESAQKEAYLTNLSFVTEPTLGDNLIITPNLPAAGHRERLIFTKSP